MKKLLTIIAGLGLYSIATPAYAQACDAMGSNWQGSVQMGAAYYNLELRRQTCGSNVWNFYLRPTSGGGAPSQGQVTVTPSGPNITVAPMPGTPTGCALRLAGTYARRDVINGIPARGSGTATCDGVPITGVWRANIR